MNRLKSKDEVVEGWEEEGEENDGENDSEKCGAEEIERPRDAIDQSITDDKGDDGRENGEVVTRGMVDFGDDGENEHADCNCEAGGDGEFFDVFQELVLDAGSVFF